MPSPEAGKKAALPDANPFSPPPVSPAFSTGENGSSYSTHTLRTLKDGDRGNINSDDELDNDDAHSRIIHVYGGDGMDTDQGGASDSSNGTIIPLWQTSAERRRIVIRALAQLAILFVCCLVLLGGTLYLALPDIDEADRPAFRIPKNFDQLKGLNNVLQRYKDENFARVMLCWVVVYMFLQAFSVPGSMYMSILAGAMWGVPLAIPIVCASVATGATICYLISKFLGEVLYAIPSWKVRVDSWKAVLDRQRDDMLSYLIVIRMMPVPPHNVVNILAPHLGIGLPLFWFSTFCGIFAISVIHTTIGEKLDQMTSPADFKLFTWRNALLLGGVCVAVLIPVVLRKRSAVAQNPLEEADAPETGRLRLDDDDELPWSNQPGKRRALVGMGRSGRRADSNDDRDDDDDDDDELPPIRMRGAIAGFSRRSECTDEDYDGLLDDVDEDPANVDYDPSRRWSGSANEDEASSLRGFKDRSEHVKPKSRSGKADALSSISAGHKPLNSKSKAAHLLGLNGRGSASSVGLLLSSSDHHGGSVLGETSIADSAAGGLGLLWSKVTSSSSQPSK